VCDGCRAISVRALRGCRRVSPIHHQEKGRLTSNFQRRRAESSVPPKLMPMSNCNKLFILPSFSETE
jgi:hypothetical protein